MSREIQNGFRNFFYDHLKMVLRSTAALQTSYDCFTNILGLSYNHLKIALQIPYDCLTNVL